MKRRVPTNLPRPASPLRRVRVSWWAVLAWALLLLCLAGLVFAQDDDLGYPVHIYSGTPQVIITLLWSAIYLVLYAVSLVVPMGYMGRFTGVDATLILWIAVLWLGGMGANFAGYAVAGPHRWLAVLIAAPLIFGWCVLIGTRSWADLSLREAIVVGIVAVALCTPYFGPTWTITREPPPPREEESRLQVPARASARITPLRHLPAHAACPLPRSCVRQERGDPS